MGQRARLANQLRISIVLRVNRQNASVHWPPTHGEGDARAEALGAQFLRVGNVLQVPAAVPDIMPDDASLFDLSQRQGKLRLRGRSPAEARLLLALASDPFRNPTFAVPLTRAPGRHADLLAIRTEPAP